MATLNDVYPVGIKREVATALRPVFGNNFPIEALRNQIFVGWEYPNKEIRYPAIYITFTEGPIQNVGVGHYEVVRDDQGDPKIARHFKFTGQLNFNVMALTPKDRDEISAALIQIIAMGMITPEFVSFHDEIDDSDYITLALMHDKITPGGQQEGTVPWGDDEETVFIATYSVDVFGEFWSDTETGDLIEISEIDLYPYRTGEAKPW